MVVTVTAVEERESSANHGLTLMYSASDVEGVGC